MAHVLKPTLVARSLRVINWLPRLIDPTAEAAAYAEARARICCDAVTGSRFCARDKVWVQAKNGTLRLVVNTHDLDYSDQAERPTSQMIRSFFLNRCPGRHFRKSRSKRREHPSLKSERRESHGRKLRKRGRARRRRLMPVLRRNSRR